MGEERKKFLFLLLLICSCKFQMMNTLSTNTSHRDDSDTTVTWSPISNVTSGPGIFVVDAALLYQSWYLPIFLWVITNCLSILPGNLLILIAFIQNPALHTPTNIFILNLSLCDLMTSIVAGYFLTMNYTMVGLKFVLRSKFGCLISLSFVLLTFTSALFAILALSVERFIAVVMPLHYNTIVTCKRAVTTCAVLWAVCLVVSCAPLTGWNNWQPGIACFTHLVLPPAYTSYAFLLTDATILISSFILHSIICFIAWKKSKVTPAQVVTTTATPNISAKITRMFLWVIGVFYFCWIPWIVCTCITLTTYRPTIRFRIFYDFSKGLLCLNGVLNPLIYARQNANYRNAFKKILRIKRREIDPQ